MHLLHPGSKSEYQSLESSTITPRPFHWVPHSSVHFLLHIFNTPQKELDQIFVRFPNLYKTLLLISYLNNNFPNVPLPISTLILCLLALLKKKKSIQHICSSEFF